MLVSPVWIAFAAGWVAATVAYALPACGGGGAQDGVSNSSTPLPTVGAQPDTVDHYLAPLFDHPTHGIVTTLDGAPYAEWTASAGKITWKGSEYFSIQPCGPKNYAFLDRLDQFALEGVVNKVNGVVLPCSPGTSVYLPFDLPGAGITFVQSWFFIHNADGTRNRPGYYEAEYRTGQTITNTCWLGAGLKTRLALQHQEAWWDPDAGWSVGSSPKNPGALPWVDGVPVEIDVYLGRTIYIGRDAGPYWAGNNDGVALCLRSS